MQNQDLVSRRQGELEKCWKTGYEEMKAEFGKYLDVRGGFQNQQLYCKNNITTLFSETNLRQLLSSEITAIVRPLLESAIGNSAISKIQLDYEIHRSITLLQAHARRNLIRRKIRNLRAQFPFASLQAHALGALARRKISQVRDEHRQYPFVVTLQAGARGTLARFYASQLRDEYRKYSSVTSLQAHARGALQRRLMQRVRGDCRITTLGIKPLWAITILMLVFFATVILQHHLHTGDNLLRQPVVTNDSIQLAKMRSSFR